MRWGALLLWPALVPGTAMGSAVCAGRMPTYEQFLRGEVVTLRQSSSDKNTNEEPALLVWTSSEVEDSVTVDAALAVPLCNMHYRVGAWGGDGLLKPTVEYHRSTVTAKEANVLNVGMGYEGVLTPPVGDAEHHIVVFSGYKDDRVLTGEGWQTSVAWSPLGTALKLGTPIRSSWPPLAYWLFSAAVQHEHGNGVLPDQAGDVFRFKPSIAASAFLFESRRASLSAGYAGWFNVERNGVFETYDEYQDLFTAGLSWNLLFALDKDGKQIDRSAVALCLDYVSGEDPEKGKQRETYARVALKLRL